MEGVIALHVMNGLQLADSFEFVADECILQFFFQQMQYIPMHVNEYRVGSIPGTIEGNWHDLLHLRGSDAVLLGTIP